MILRGPVAAGPVAACPAAGYNIISRAHYNKIKTLQYIIACHSTINTL